MMAIIVVLISVVPAVTSSWTAFEREVEARRALLQGAGTAYAAAMSEAVAVSDRSGVNSVLRGVTDLPGIVQTDVFRADGRRISQLGSGALLIGRDGDPEDMTHWQIWQASQLRVTVPVRHNGEVVGQMGLLADIGDLRQHILQDLWRTLLSALVLLAIGLAITWALITRLTGPLRRLTAHMAEIANDPGQETKPVTAGHDETGVLAETFNGMMAVIRERDRRIARHMETLEDTVEERTHDLREARDAAEAANAAKSDFLATMSHEIRTPMNGMMVMADMLAASDLPARQRRYADIISRSGGSLLTIINDILDLSKIESGKLDLEDIAVSPERLALDTASLFWERAREKALDLTVCVSPRVPDEIVSDPTRLNQVITNLVNNALKFTETGGVTVRIDAGKPRPDGTVQLVYAVEDTGVGIPADKLPHIFDAFSQADQTTTRRFGGTGLGLAVCKRLVTAMGGEISVKSREGEGSEFRVDLTVAVKKPVEPAAPSALSVWLECDTALQRRALAYALKVQGCKIARKPGEASIRIVPSHRAAAVSSALPTVILSDIGDMYADRVIADGRASDVLPLPFSRADVRGLLERASTGRFRGTDALNEVETTSTLPDLAGLHVLAVDDNAVNREVLREALTGIGVTADFAENGEEALKALAQGDYDLVLMDGSMPVMDGFEATRRLRQRELDIGAPRLPVIALTAQVAGRTEDDWTAAGADGYVSKPFTIERLADALAGTAPSPERDVGSAQPTDLDNRDIFDAATLEQFAALGGASRHRVRNTVWNMFVERAPVGLDDLSKAVESGQDAKECARLAHALKSMALSAGAARFADGCSALESAAIGGGNHAAIFDHLSRIGATLEQTLHAMDAEMSAGDSERTTQASLTS